MRPGKAFGMCLMILLLTGMPVMFAAEQEKEKEPQQEDILAGRIFDCDEDKESDQQKAPDMDLDKKKGLDEALVRIVEIKTGVMYEDRTDTNGCYEIRKVHPGTYSLSVTYENLLYLFADKIIILPKDSSNNLYKLCFTRRNKKECPKKEECPQKEERCLKVLNDDECDTCKRYPLFLLFGTSALQSIVTGGGGGEEVSQSGP